MLKLNEGAALVFPEGGGPAGVVDGLPNEKPPLVFVAAGVVLPAWLDEAVLDPKLPNKLEPPALPALPKTPDFGAWLELADSEDFSGVERPGNIVALLDVCFSSEPVGFPKLNPES